MVEKPSKENFDLFNTLSGRAYPSEDVVVYVNEARMHELKPLREELQVQSSDKTKRAKELKAQVDEIVADIKASALTFHIRGVAPAVTDLLVEKYRKSDDYETLEAELLAATLIRVTNADGEVDERKFSVEECAQIRDMLPRSAYEKISKTVTKLNLDGAIYDQTVDSGFLQKP